MNNFIKGQKVIYRGNEKDKDRAYAPVINRVYKVLDFDMYGVRIELKNGHYDYYAPEGFETIIQSSGDIVPGDSNR